MKYLYALVVCFFLISQSLLAQQETHELTGLKQAGQLVTIELQPSDKKLKFKFAGNKVAQWSLSEMKFELEFGSGDQKKRLPMVLVNDSFEISKEKLSTEELLIRVKSPKKQESFRFFLK